MYYIYIYIYIRIYTHTLAELITTLNVIVFLSLRLKGEETLKYRIVCRPPCKKV